MSSSGRNSPPSAYPTDRRRSSFSAGQFAEIFGTRSGSMSGSGSSGQQGPITQAAAAAHRRLSVSTLGLSGSPTQTSPFTPGGRPRAESISSGSNSDAIDESPFEEGDAPLSSIPSTPFGRRLSFGARAMRDMRAPASTGGSGNGNHRPSVSGVRKPSPPHPPTAAASKPGRGSFDVAENFRSRAERASISSPTGPPPASFHQRAKSISTMEQPAREMPKQPRVPDAIQERMLRGDFYMD